MFWMIILFPLLGAIINGLFCRQAPKHVSHLVAVAAMFGSFVFAVLTFVAFYSAGAEPILHHAYDWIMVGGFEAPLQFSFDRLSGFMVLLITGIGTLIHIYAGGYMHEEAKTSRFFCYLNLFVFMMLLLVLGDNMLVMFVGWEGVGLCSYLLIGYWFEEDANAAAGMKAFLVNRIGDIGVILGIFMTYRYFNTISFTELRAIFMTASAFDVATMSAISIIAFCFFLGVCGKSAQLPLYIWLPDAMAGPTPVSALIHAATMVTAGVFLMTRLSFLYFAAPGVMALIAVVGALTALLAATIALVQTDIKKVLAYSTVSQLGFMVLACGVGAFGVGMFHLLTHACFKALLFLGAGSVIVAMHHKQEMPEMGGLKKYLPKTHLAFAFGVLAIIGTPGFSGFFSKDEILFYAFLNQPILWIVAVIAAACTAFYMVRLYCLTFLGENRSDPHTREHLHETPSHMWMPLWILAFLSLTIGWLGIPAFLGGGNFLHSYFEPVVQVPPVAIGTWQYLSEPHSHALEWGLMIASVTIVFSAAIISFLMYRHGLSQRAARWAAAWPTAHNLLHNKYYVDELYHRYLVSPLSEISDFLFKIIDVKVIDGIVNAVAGFCSMIAGILSFKMTGSMHRHGMVVVVGIICLLSVLLF